MKSILQKLALAALAVGLTASVQALPSLRISDGTTTITIADNGVGDGNAASGVVMWSGTVGVWDINVNTGLTKPTQGSALNPYMDLNFIDHSSAAGTLTLWFSETDFGPSNGSALAHIGGTAQGSVSYSTYWSSSNALFATSTLLTNQGPFAGGAYSGTSTAGPLNNSGPYSLTQVISLTHSASGTTSGDAELSVPDSGTSILLLGAGLTGLGLFGRFRRRFV